MIPNWLNILGMWNLNPSILIGTVIFWGAYFVAVKRIEPKHTIQRAQIGWFSLGTLVILLALISPLDRLGDEYLFSAHMFQHMLLAMVAPPLLLAGTPAWLVEKSSQWPGIRKIAKILTKPAVGFFLFNLVYLGWHIQGFYDAALNNETIHIIEHLLFLFTGVLNWWPVLSPTAFLPRLSYPGQVLYLFLEAIPSTILGAIISFSPTILYPTYAAAPRILKLSPMDDQQVAGLLMALPAGMIYMSALSIVFIKWLNSESRVVDRKSDQRNHL